MKHIKSLILIALVMWGNSSLRAQVNLFTGNGDGISWHDPSNWELGEVPYENIGSVHIQAGSTVEINSPLLWNLGIIYGEGIVVNNSTITIRNESATGHWKSLATAIHLINNGVLSLEADPGFEMGGLSVLPPSSMLTNSPTGTVNLTSTSIQGASGGGTPGGTWINEGVINKTTNGSSAINTINFHNHGQPINVTDGELTFTTTVGQAAIHEDATFNISQNATLIFSGINNFIGSINGDNQGIFRFAGSETNIIGEVDVNISGNGINWFTTSIKGGGSLNNYTTMRTEDIFSKGVYESTTIKNYGMFEINASSNLKIEEASTFINEENGTVIFSGVAANITGQTGGLVINKGVMIKLDSETTYLTASFINEGLLDINDAAFNFSENGINNSAAGRIIGTGILFLPPSPNPAINNGIVAPGGENIGKITASGFTQNAMGSLEVQINGYMPELDHDVLDISAIGDTFQGTIIPILGFEPQIDDEFIVVTSNTHNITNCDLPETTTAIFNGYEYTFDIICNLTHIKLLVTEGALTGLESILENEVDILAFPNPTESHVTIEFDKVIDEFEAIIFNSLGQRVGQQQFKTVNHIELDLNDGNGIYMIYLITNDGKTSVVRIHKI